MVHLSAKDYFRHTPWWLMLFAFALIAAIIFVCVTLFFIHTKGDNVSYCQRYISVIEKYNERTESYPNNLAILHSTYHIEDSDPSRCGYIKNISGYTLSTDLGFGSAYYISGTKKWSYD